MHRFGLKMHQKLSGDWAPQRSSETLLLREDVARGRQRIGGRKGRGDEGRAESGRGKERRGREWERTERRA